MEELLKQVLENQQLILKRLNKLESADQSDFVGPDEALKILGFPATQNGRRRLQALREKGFLKRFASRRPYQYQREELLSISNGVQTGVIDTKVGL